MFALQNAPLGAFELAGLGCRRHDTGRPRSDFDLEVHLWERSDALGRRDVRRRPLRPGTIDGLLGTSCAARPTVRRHRCAGSPRCRCSTKARATRVAADVGRPAVTYPADACVRRLFEEHAAATPDAVALSGATRTLTYAALDARANRLARACRRRASRRESRVAVQPAATSARVVGDCSRPSRPAPRTCRSTRPTPPSASRGWCATRALDAVVTDARPRRRRWHGARATVRCSTSTRRGRRRRQARPPLSGRAAEDALAYVMYTSGSTGRPKGVVVRHRSCRLVRHELRRADGRDAVPPARVGVVRRRRRSRCWAPLLNGGAWSMPRGRRRRRGAGRTIREAPRHARPCLTTALFNVVVDETCARPRRAAGSPDRRRGRLGPAGVPRGDARARHDGHARLRPDREHDVRPRGSVVARASGPRASAPIGRPVANTRAYVLDAGARSRAGRRAGRAVRRRRRRRARVPRPAGADRRALRADPFGTRRTPLPDRRPRAAAPDGAIEFLGRARRAGEDPRLPHRARRGRSRPRPSTRRCVRPLSWCATRRGPDLVAYVVPDRRTRAQDATARRGDRSA